MTEPVPMRTPLYSLHQALGGKFIPFAGYELPVQYRDGILAEHLHTRAHASLFDVSHMGQAEIEGAGAASMLEELVPSDIVGLAPGQIRYTALTNETGGIRDDITVGRKTGDRLRLVLNASRKAADLDYLRRRFGPGIVIRKDRALLALQGPSAVSVLRSLKVECPDMRFMTAASVRIGDADCIISRSGYTGEDGFEISIDADAAEGIARLLLGHPEVKPAGLGARDLLRLEAGLCLYGSDIDETTTPIEAGLAWIIPERRRHDGGFTGAETILRQLREGVARRRIGLRPQGRIIARTGTPILDGSGMEIGIVTSGGFSPVLNGPIAMGYVAFGHAAVDTSVGLLIRGSTHLARIVALPFIHHRYYRG